MVLHLLAPLAILAAREIAKKANKPKPQTYSSSASSNVEFTLPQVRNPSSSSTSDNNTSDNSTSSDSISDGYKPQPELKGCLELCDYEDCDGVDEDEREKIIATFSFEGCEWISPIYAPATKTPAGVGSFDGLGHITNQRIVLFWDVKAALSGETAGPGDKIVAKALEKLTGDIGIGKIKSRSRKLMEKNAESCGNGIGFIFFPDNPDDEDEFLAKTSEGIYFPVTDRLLGPTVNMTFRPNFFESTWAGDHKAMEFEKILNKLGVKSRKVDSVWMRDDGLVGKYL